MHNVYDAIASHFSDTRRNPWPLVAEFLQRLPAGALVADVGGGNGKHGRVGAPGEYVVTDACAALLRHCPRQAIRAHCLAQPFRDGAFDAVLCIAVVHHLRSAARRRDALAQIVRIVRRRGGRGLVYVWAAEGVSDKVRAKSRVVRDGVVVPWKCRSDGRTYERFYHWFAAGELAALLDTTAVRVVREYLDCQNWAVEFERR